MDDKNLEIREEEAPISEIEVANPIANELFNPIEGDRLKYRPAPRSVSVKHSRHSFGITAYAFWGGIAMIILGVLAMINPGPIFNLPVLKVDLSYGLAMGLFPMNIFNKVALLLFGIVGVACSTRLNASMIWGAVVFFVMGGCAILGTIPVTSTLFGYWPLYGTEVFAHGLFALMAVLSAYYSISSRDPNL